MLQEFQNGLAHLERAPGESIHIVENDLQNRLDVIITNCERLDILVNKEPPTTRANAKLRTDQLKYDCQHLQAALRNMQNRRYDLRANIAVFLGACLNPQKTGAHKNPGGKGRAVNVGRVGLYKISIIKKEYIFKYGLIKKY